MSVNNKYISIEQIIAKIDNDFNPDNSDWIPRVAAWCIDALQQLRLFNKVNKKVKLKVQDRTARFVCDLNDIELKVYDERGCKVDKAETVEEWGCCNPSTGEEESSNEIKDDYTELTDTIGLQNNPSKGGDVAYMATVQTKDYNERYNEVYDMEYVSGSKPDNHRYILSDKNTININWDAEYIYIVYKVVETIKSEYYGIDLPVIPNNGLLIEALTQYCIYKMLCRGYKHPVMNLQASQYGTNPYYNWINLSDRVKIEITLDNQSEDSIDESSRMFRSNFYIDGFDPRR